MKQLKPFVSDANHSATCSYCGLPMPGPPIAGEQIYCCFGCQFADGISTDTVGTNNQIGPASAFGLSVFFTMNVVMMTMPLWSDVSPTVTSLESALRNFLRYGAMAFSLPVLLLLGRPLVSHALMSLRRSVLTTDLLLATGVLAAYLVSIVHTLRGEGHVYFEVGCVILVLVTLGRWMEAAGKSNACAALDQLEKLVPDKVQLWQAGRSVEVARVDVVDGDLVRVLAGQRIPLDGIVRRGRGVVDEQLFTGESIPVEKRVHDLLLSGSLNLDGDILFEVTAASNGGALRRLVDAVRTARLSKGRYQQLSDAWSERFFPLISLIALSAFVWHGMRVDWDYGLLTALSVVLIACPCALALATPVAVWAALGTAANNGVLFRSGAALERLAAIRAIRWDKTGTLTTGSPRVRRMCCETPSERSEVERLASLLTHSSHHLFSKAIREYLSETADPDPQVEVQTVAGRGLRMVSPAGSTILLGSARWMEESGLNWGPRISSLLQESQSNRSSLVALGYDGMVRGLFLLEERIRPEASAALDRCRHLGLHQAILTGDRAVLAVHLASMLNLSVAAEVLPEQKLAAIRQAHDEFGMVAMIGDGLNDAPALAGADLGIALGCGADISRDSADVCLLTNDLRLVPWSIEFARQTVRTIRMNLCWSFGYNSLGVVVAACGQLHPAAAAALMVISSVMVLGNSLRLCSGEFSSTTAAVGELNDPHAIAAGDRSSSTAETPS